LAEDAAFPRLVALACHDLRTPLATVAGFAHTLSRMDGLQAPVDRYVEMMIAASGEMAELLDGLGLLARIEAGRYEHLAVAGNSLDLAHAVAARLGAERVEVSGAGGAIAVDPTPAEQAVHGLVRCALRHGGLERVSVSADGSELRVSPVTEAAAPIVTAQDARDLGAAVGVRVVTALGGSVELEADELIVRLPAGG
jgi:signal transduction histidine kinase